MHAALHVEVDHAREERDLPVGQRMAPAGEQEHLGLLRIGVQARLTDHLLRRSVEMRPEEGCAQLHPVALAEVIRRGNGAAGADVVVVAVEKGQPAGEEEAPFLHQAARLDADLREDGRRGDEDEQRELHRRHPRVVSQRRRSPG